VESYYDPWLQAELAWRHERLAASRGTGPSRRQRRAARRSG
jgi:hypothetical protein